MAIKIISTSPRNQATGVPQYWTRLCDSLAQHDIHVEWVMLDEWRKNHPADAASDLLIVDNQHALEIDPAYAVVAVQHGCAMEHGLRVGTMEHCAMGAKQWQAARRPRTFWVACSDWAAYHCQGHMGVTAQKIIRGGVDVHQFFPCDRQVRREAKRPVVLHHCADVNKGAGAIGKVADELGEAFEVRRLDCAPEGVADAMRDADIWLCLSASEGLPTVVQEAQATNLVVVGSNVGVLWPHERHVAVQSRQDGAVAWLDATLGAVVFDWQWVRHRPEYVADWVRRAWDMRGKLNGRDYALQWYSHALFGQKWLEAIEAAQRMFGLSPDVAKVVVGARARPAAAPQPRKQHTEHGKR